jgi:glycosyltransferase involved in cell wall biosynthesis
MQRLNVLIASHEFSPEQGSECAVGWNIATKLTKYHDVTVLCADGPALFPEIYRQAVVRYFKRHGHVSGLKVVYVKQPPATQRYARINRKLMKATNNIGWQLLYYIGIDSWHKAALKKAHYLGLHNFDVTHQLTPISFLRPGYLWKTGLPFFWGPLGGMYKVPHKFARSGGVVSLAFESLRSVNIERQVRFSSNFKNAVRKAIKIWVITEDERRVISKISGAKSEMMIDTAPPPDINGHIRRHDCTKPLKLCWSGRMESRKALPILFHAITRLNQRNNVMLDILGDGPELSRWKTVARRLSLTNIKWHGRLPYTQALEIMGQSDLFVHTSFREAASMVLLEAMGWGMPVICHDTCGMATAVNHSCGIKVPFSSPQMSIRGFQDAINAFLYKPGLLEYCSRGALRRVKELSWDAKAEHIARAYIQYGINKRRAASRR